MSVSLGTVEGTATDCCPSSTHRLFGSPGLCAACDQVIPAFEMVMRARTNVYHLECFACGECKHRFCVGDLFYLEDHRILCEYDKHQGQCR